MRLGHTAVALAISGLASSTNAQRIEHRPTGPWSIYAKSTTGEATIAPSEQLIAALPYDGASSFGVRGQDFESIWDHYDIFLIEDIMPAQDAALGEFRSVGFGNANPFGTEDVVVRIYEDNATGLPGQELYTGQLILESVPGAGFFSDGEYVTNFGGQCLPGGSYYIVWAARLDSTCGASLFFIQSGEPTLGGGDPNNAWLWNPGGGFDPEIYFPVRDPASGEQAGVNYLLFGDPANCDFPCSNPDCPADFDGDGDTDADDFFAYLDLFASGDPCADIDQDGDADADDFFAYLDLFVRGCD